MVDSLLSVLAVFITMSITRSLGANVKSWLDTIKLALSELTFFDTEGGGQMQFNLLLRLKPYAVLLLRGHAALMRVLRK
jgi:hypothetical protein